MLAKALRGVGRAQMVLLALALAVILCEPTARRYGDRIQVALPMIAWGCAALNRSGSEFAARFLGMMLVLHGTKAGLGDAPVNQRPGGGGSGFPSGHTTAAAFGASALVHDCIPGAAGAKALVVIAAAYVGGSRIEAGAHDIWQVLAGGLLGWGSDRVLRRNLALRARIGALATRLRQAAVRGLRQTGRRGALVFGLVRPGALPARGGAVLALALSLAALADPARAEWELSLYGGVQTAPHSTVSHSALGEAHVKWEGKSFEPPPYYGLRATWWQNDRLGWGVDFNHAKVYADDPARYGYDRLEFTDGLNLITLNVWRRWPGRGRLVPYVGAGLGVAVPYVEVAEAGQTGTFGYQATGPALQLVAGASLPLRGRWAAFGEWKGTWSRHDVDLDTGESLETEIITNAVNLGISFRF